ncbi:MAG: AI-2E family transporter [Planctomycetes bacterium]|nr:AI-2E family transporter [Planctomycetota bacterium]
MLERLSPARRNLALLVVGLLVIWFSWTVRTVLNPVILGYLLAYVLHPLVETLERRGWSRRTAVNLIFMTFALLMALTALSLFWQGKALFEQISSMFSPTDDANVPALQARLDIALADLQQQLLKWGVLQAGTETKPLEPWSLHAVFDALRNWWRSEMGTEASARAGAAAAEGLFGAVKRVSGSVMSVVSLVFLLPIYTYFLLFELERIHAFVRRYLPRRERERIARIGEQIGEVLASFFRGRLFVCLLKGLFLTVALFLCGVPYAVLLGFLGGMLALVPVVGPVVAFLLAFLVAMLEFDSVMQALMWVGGVYGVAEVIEGYVLIPKILGDSLGLHPVVVILALTIGGAALGLFGLLVALPATATVIILVRELILPALRVLAEENSTAPPKTG